MIINTEKWDMDSPMETLYTYYAEKYPINNAQICCCLFDLTFA